MTPREANALYGEYLEHSYRYYMLDTPVIQDNEFDGICVRLLEHWPIVTHRLRALTTEDDLRAGTGFQIRARSLPWPFVELIEKNPNVALKFVFDPSGGL